MANMRKTRYFVLFWLAAVACGSKYSESVNKKSETPTERRPFRMNKVNLVWEKAQKRLTAHDLADLYTDLNIQDRLELDAKKKRVDGYDQDGETAALTQEKMFDILKRYRLLDEAEFNNRVEDNEAVEKDPKYKKMDAAIMMDKKLGKLWKKAQMSGFSDEELEDLKKEFWHHRQKVEQFDQLKSELDEVDGISDNSIDHFKSDDKDVKSLRKKREDLKHKHRNLKESYQYLEGLTEQKDALREKLPFNEPKVIELWLLAKKTNFTEMELESFKAELQHFEHKLQKHEHFKSELGGLELSIKKKGKENLVPPQKHIDLEKKVNEYGYKVKKFHTELKTRITRAMGSHSEL